MDQQTENISPKGPAGAAAAQAAKCLLLAAGLFPLRGGLAWAAGWLFLALYAGWSFLNAALLARRSPALLASRLAPTPDPAPGLDYALALATGAFYSGLILVCAARPEWPAGTGWLAVRAAAFAGLAAAYALASWALLSNPFARKAMLVESGQTVASGGPYARVRHPLYAAFALHCACAPAALGSAHGYLPALGAVLAVLGRVKYEDVFLRGRLEGYEAYARSVKYLALPGIW